MNRYIVSDPSILGGKPVIKGTRIPVDQILFLLKDGFTVEAIHEFYPHVDEKTIEGTIDEAAKILNNVDDFKRMATKSLDSGVIGVSQNLSPDQLDKKLNALFSKKAPESFYGKYTPLSTPKSLTVLS